MDNLRNSIKLYFDTLNPEHLFKKKGFDLDIHERKGESFMESSRSIRSFDHRTEDELNNVFRKVSEDWMFAPGKQFSNTQKSPFFLLTHFNEQVLKEVEAEPFVHYQHLLKWRDLSYKLGEDIFSTSFLAYRDIIARKNRNYFSWRPTLFSDNQRLRNILQKGVAENHSHFWASSLTFDLNWLALMNHFPFFKDKVIELGKGKKLGEKSNVQFDAEKVEFEVQIKKAIALRLVLLKAIEFYENKCEETREIKDLRLFLKQSSVLDFDINFLFKTPNSIDSFDLIVNFQKIQDQINSLGQEKGLKVPHNGSKKVIDYALSQNISPSNFNGCYFLAGERNLLYRAFKILYNHLDGKKEIRVFEKLLHAYLLYKNLLRNEIVQTNERYGFGNFKSYQDRKTFFIEGKTLYETIFQDIALNYNTQLMNIVSNEFRIGPKKTGFELKKTIENILRVRQYHESDYDWEKQLKGTSNPLNIIKNQKVRGSEYVPKDTFFVVHFFKRNKEAFHKNGVSKKSFESEVKQKLNCRDSKLRKEVKDHAHGIKDFREKYPVYAKLVRGIDAASSELEARPEAFAQAFRFLKHHQIRDNYSEIKGAVVNNRLNITFHAGEDFYDVIDGLRYLDESLFFLNMENGDRFGHAIALGIDVKKYFELKHHKLMLTKHTLLDNLAWLLSKVRKFGLGQHVNEVYRLETLFKSLFSEIYLNNCRRNKFQHIHYQQYFDAWKLRGDNPELYNFYFSEFKNKYPTKTIGDYFENLKNITYWERCSLNNFNPKLESIRKREEIAELYFEYHYNSKVKDKGFEITQFEITTDYIELVNDIQKQMMTYIASLNIAIETNPTSNYLIGPIQKYIEHPITKWFNLGLEIDPTKIQSSPQLSVSINTDDAGIFSTSLENEYALMAIALEKEKDEFGNPKYKSAMIYDWLDRVREMGLQQSFIDKINLDKFKN